MIFINFEDRIHIYKLLILKRKKDEVTLKKYQLKNSMKLFISLQV